MPISIADSISPTLFISYSRRQQGVAALVHRTLSALTPSVLRDIEEIAVGDRWRSEIERMIAACDELVLLLSDDSLTSPVVEEEVAAAERLGRIVRPILVQPLGRAQPDALADLNYLDVSQCADDKEKVAAILGHFRRIGDQDVTDMNTLKTVASRTIWPTFDRHQATFSEASWLRRSRDLNAACASYPARSTLALNAGLAACQCEDWTGGLARLDAYASSANSFAGWYFLALHLPRCHSVLQMAPALGDKTLKAAERANSMGDNPLAILLHTVLAVGIANRGKAFATQRLQDLPAIAAETRESPGEYARLFWCLKASLEPLQVHVDWVWDFLEERAA